MNVGDPLQQHWHGPMEEYPIIDTLTIQISRINYSKYWVNLWNAVNLV